MKFYLALDDQGRKQLRGTQDDIKLVNKKQFETVELPTDKAGLMELVQESFDTIFELQGQINSSKFDASINTTDIPKATGEFFEKATLRSSPTSVQTAWTATEIEDFLLNKASVAQVENIFSCLGNRFAEMVKSCSSSTE